MGSPSGYLLAEGSPAMTLDRPVTLSFSGAIQAIAALEDRIAGPLRYRDVAEMDAAHEAAVAEMDRLVGIEQYQAEGR
jgi:hypothetical protein